jgi:fatty-acyl-CoA synthase
MPKLTDLPLQAVAKAQQYAERGSAELHYLLKMLEAGAFKLEPPQNVAAMVADIRRWGEFGMIPALNARRTPNRTAIIDDDGEVTFKELEEAAHEVANGLLAMGVKGGDGVAILARNHRWFLIAVYGAARAGARIILLNSEFSGPQIKEVSEREGAKVIIYDDEYCEAVSKADPELGKLRALGKNPDKDEPSGSTDETLEELGFLHATIAMMLGTTLVLRRRFKPVTVLEDIEKNKVTAMVVVPVMLSRILDALDAMERKPNLSSLRIVFVSGSQLGAELATRALKDLGPVIYNLYGSTEIAFATIARPKDLSINPATVGPVVKGVKVKILDDNGNELPQGEVGRIFVGNFFPFEGYTGGGGKQIVGGLMSSGDVGYFDEHGLLYVSGRDDEMIVSGGENVFPAEVEDLISGHPEVIEATALGVEDKEWGHRLRAFVVKAEGASVGEDDIKTYVKDHLARYKVPREVVFLDELPRNPTGKILKRELREIDVD